MWMTLSRQFSSSWVLLNGDEHWGGKVVFRVVVYKRRLSEARIPIQAVGSSGGSGPVMLLACERTFAGRDAVLHQQDKLVFRQRFAEIVSLHLVTFVGAQEA
jgi:hypothetical protein